MKSPAWDRVRRTEPPGYHYEFAATSIVALSRGKRLTGRAPGGLVEAWMDAKGWALSVDGVERARGDAFDVGREFYALVGFNEAPAAAADALGGDLAREIGETLGRAEVPDTAEWRARERT